MSASKHTPGPWVESISEDSSIEVWNSDCSMFIAKRHQMNDRGEAKANARLIAAAPDLLAALERVAFVLESPAAQTVGGAIRHELSAAARSARRAIAEARGEG